MRGCAMTQGMRLGDKAKELGWSLGFETGGDPASFVRGMERIELSRIGGMLLWVHTPASGVQRGYRELIGALEA